MSETLVKILENSLNIYKGSDFMSLSINWIAIPIILCFVFVWKIVYIDEELECEKCGDKFVFGVLFSAFPVMLIMLILFNFYIAYTADERLFKMIRSKAEKSHLSSTDLNILLELFKQGEIKRGDKIIYFPQIIQAALTQPDLVKPKETELTTEQVAENEEQEETESSKIEALLKKAKEHEQAGGENKK